MEESLERAEALLEQVRRLEQGLSGLRPEAEKEKPESWKDGGEVREEPGPGAGRRYAAGEPEAPERALSPLEERDKRAGAGEAGTLEVPERAPAPLKEREAGKKDGVEERTLEVPERVLTPLEIQEAWRDRTEIEDLAGAGRTETLADRPERRTAPALLRQLERLERAAAVSVGGAAPWRRAGGEMAGRESVSLPGPAGFAGVMAGAGRGWAPGGGLERPGSLSAGAEREWPGALSAGELRWAERADRVFRRDSRRYDGGFYLF